MNFASNEANRDRALAEMVKAGYVFKGLKPNWCFDCGSALAEAEGRVCRQESPAIDVAFPVDESARLAQAFGLAALDKAGSRGDLDHHTVDDPRQPGAQHPPRVRIRTGRHRRAPAGTGHGSGRKLPRPLQAQKAGSPPAPARGSRSHRVPSPFFDRVSPVPYLAEYVGLDAGTGIVHSAPPTAWTISMPGMHTDAATTRSSRR